MGTLYEEQLSRHIGKESERVEAVDAVRVAVGDLPDRLAIA